MAGKTQIEAGIKLDGEKEFKAAVTDCGRTLSNLKTESDLVKTKFEGQANTLEALRAKHEVLNKTLEAHRQKEEAVKNGLDHAKESYTNIVQGLEKLLRKQEEESTKLEQLKAIYGESSQEVKDQKKVLDELAAAVQKGEENYQRAENRIEGWQARLNTAEAQTIRANRALDENSEYLNEAGNSADGCARSIDQYGRRVRNAEEATEEFGAHSSNAIEELSGVLVSAGIAAGVKEIATALYECTEAAAEFETSIAKVMTIADESKASAESMKQSVLALSSEMGEDASFISEATYQAISASVDTADAIGVVGEASKLATGGFTDTTTAIDILTTAMNAYGLETDQVTRISDVLVTTQNLGKTSVGEVASAMGKVIPLAAAYGMEIENLSSGYAVLTANGIKTDEATTYIKAALNELGDSGSTVGKILVEQTGKGFAELMNQGMSLGDVLQIIGGSVDGNAAAFNNLWSSAEAGVGMLSIFNSGANNFNEVLGQMQSSSGATEAAFQKMTNTAEYAKQKFTNSIQNMKIAIGDELSPALKMVYETGTDAFEWATDLVKKNPQIISVVTGLISAIAVLSAGVAALTILPKITAMFKAFNAVLSANPAIIVATAIAGLAIAVGTYVASIEEAETESSVLADEAERLAGATDDLSEKMKKSKEAYEENQTSIESQYGALQIMSDKLYELAEAESLSNTQKAEMNAYIDQLNEAMPELNLALDEHTGKLNIDKEATDSYIESLKQKAIVEESEKRINVIIQEQAEANLTAADAIVKKKAAEDERARLKKEWNKIEDDSITKTGVEIEQQEKLSKQISECDESIKSYSETIEENNKKSGECDVRVKEVTESLGEYERQAGSSGEATDNMTAAVSQMSDEQAKAIDAIKDKYEELRSSIEQNIESSISAYEKFNGGTKITSDEVIENLDSQIEGLTNWSDNMIILAHAAGNGMSKEFLSYLTDLGPEGANLVQTLVKSLKDQDGDFEGICKRWMKVLNIKEGTKEELSEATAELTSSVGKMGEAAENGGKTVYGAFKDAFDGTSDLATQSGGKTTDAFVLSFQDLANAAGKYGIQIPESLAGGIADGSIQPEQAMAQVDALIQEKAATLSVIMGELGIDMTSEMQSGIESGGTSAIEAVQVMNQAIAKKQEEMSVEAGNKGKEASKKTAEGIGSGSEAVSEAARIVMSGAASVGQGYVIQFPPIGYNMMSGVASGLNSGSALVYDKVREILNQAKREAEKINDQHSPSKVWRNKVGLMMSQGMALGMQDGKKDIVTQSVELARAALKGAQDEAEIRSPSKTWKNKVGKQMASGVAFGIKEGTGKAKKSARDLAKAVLSEAKDWISGQKKIASLTAKEETYMWDRLIKDAKKKGGDYYKIIKKNADAAKKEIARSNKDYGVSGSGLDMYKTYYNVSAKAEKDYWATVRKSKGLSAAQKLEADKNYYDAVENLNDQLKDLNQDYEENVKETNESMIESINEVTEAYADAVAERKESILSSFGLFDEFYSESESGDKLLYNLRSQVAGIADWEKELEELQSRGNLSDAVMEELKEMGPAASASIHALNSLTDEQLKEYNSLYTKRDELAASQAAKDTERQRAESEAKIQQIKANAQKELDAYKTEYDKAYAELTKSMEAPLKQLAQKATTLGETATLNLVRGFKSKANQKSTKEEVKKGAEKIADGLDGLPKEGKKIGKNTLQGILDGLMDGKKIKGGAKDFIQDLSQAIKKEAGIRSPSRLFKQEVGVQISAGVGEGIADGTPKAAKAGMDMIAAMLEQSKQQVAKQQAALSEYAASLNTGASIATFNNLIETPTVQPPVVNMDNTGLLNAFGQMLSMMEEYFPQMANQQIVMDTGKVVGETYSGMSESFAMAQRRVRR